jgi:hypothetical protein
MVGAGKLYGLMQQTGVPNNGVYAVRHVHPDFALQNFVNIENVM